MPGFSAPAAAGRKKTSAEWLYGALKNGEPITLYEDFFFTPIYAADLADTLALLLDRRARGLYHVAGRDRVSKFTITRDRIAA